MAVNVTEFSPTQVDIKPPVTPDVLPLADTSKLVRKFDFPQTPEQFRRVLGLPDEKPIAAEDSFTEKEAKIISFVNEQQAGTPQGRFASDTDLDYQDRMIQEQLSDQSLKTRLWRAYIGKRLNMFGLKQGSQVLHAIESAIPIYSKGEINPGNVATLIKSLDPLDEQAALAKFNLAVERARKFSFLPRGGDFKKNDKGFIETITTLATMPEEVFERIEHQFRGRTQVLYHPGSFTGIYALSTYLMPIIRQGGLTPKQQELLDKAVIWKSLSGALPFKSKEIRSDSNYEYSLSFSELSDTGITERFDKFYPYLVDWASGRIEQGIKFSSQGDMTGEDFIRGLLYIESTGQLGKLDFLMKNGWDCTDIYRKMKAGREELDKAINETIVFQSDPIKMGWVRALAEFYYPNAKLPAGNLDYLRKMLENKDSLIEVACIVNALPRVEGFDPKKLLVNEGDAVIGLERYEFNNYLRALLGMENLPLADRIVVQTINSLLSEEGRGAYNQSKAFSPQDLMLFSYLILNKDRIAGQVDSSSGVCFYNASLINELYANSVPVSEFFLGRRIQFCVNQELLYPDLQMRFFDYLDNKNRVQVLANLPVDYLAKMDQEFQLMAGSFRQLEPRLQERIAQGGREIISKCFINGKPSLFFMEYALQSGFFKEAKPFFTAELVASLPEDKRGFFQTVFSLPSGVVALIGDQKMAEWSEYFVSGHPTPKFLRMVASTGQRGEIDLLLASADLTHLPSQEIEFWNYYKDIKTKSNLRNYLLKLSEKFSEFVSGGKPTAVLLENLAEADMADIIREILPDINMESLTENQQKFWSFYPSVDSYNTGNMRHFLLRNRGQFDEFIADGKPTLFFLNNVAEEAGGGYNQHWFIKEILDRIDWDKMSTADKTFWRYYSNQGNDHFEAFLLNNKDNFSQMVVEGQRTPVFYQFLLKQSPQTMFNLPQIETGLSAGQYQNFWRMALGKENIDSFLTVLPKATDEARNAFTGNNYDRTTEFLKFLQAKEPLSQSGITAETIPVITEYVAKFGLARNETLYKYFHNLYLFEHQKIEELPSEMRDLGIDSTDQVIQKLAEVRRMVFREKELRDAEELRGLSAFQIQMLANVTRYDSARFGAGNAESLGQKINQFIRGLEQNEIPDLPPGYETETIEASSVKIEFNPEAVRENYGILRQEILESIDNPASLDQLKSEAKDVIERKIAKINQILSKVTNEKQAAGITRDLQNYQSYLDKLSGVADPDFLALALLGMNFSGEERAGGEGFRGIDSLMRRLILTKLYQRHQDSPGFQENVRIKLSQDEVTAEGIDEIILTVDEMIKNHVLNLDLRNKEKYWQPEVFESILSNEGLRKNFRRIMEKFNPHIDKLRQEQANFIRTQTGVISQVKIIPDRGFVGEMAGYLADVCYVRVNDLLKAYSGLSSERPLVVPYKFVIDDPKSDEPRFVGSVLVFEVQTAKGESALLVRALDIPNESEIDISKFTENLLDKFAGVAARRGKKKVLVAGTGGTISNYSSITNHVLSSYVNGKESDPVSPVFDFNGYNITNDIYVARSV